MSEDTDPFRALSAELTRPPLPQYVGFDLGGTLFDRTPLHVESTISAFGLTHNRDKVVVAEIVRRAVHQGLDSFAFCRQAQTSLFGRESGDLREVVERKRSILDALQAKAVMPLGSVRLLDEVSHVATVFLISQGRRLATESLLRRSFRYYDLAQSCDFYCFGRDDNSSTVDKGKLLVRAFEGVDRCRAVYVGDSEYDRLTSASLCIRFLAFHPFGMYGDPGCPLISPM